MAIDVTKDAVFICTQKGYNKTTMGIIKIKNGIAYSSVFTRRSADRVLSDSEKAEILREPVKEFMESSILAKWFNEHESQLTLITEEDHFILCV
jgi:hypothetical protein